MKLHALVFLLVLSAAFAASCLDREGNKHDVRQGFVKSAVKGFKEPTLNTERRRAESTEIRGFCGLEV